MIDINFDKADQINSSFGELSSEASNIASSMKGINADIFSSYSPNSPGYNSIISEGITNIIERINDFGTSFNNSINLYKEAYEQSKIKIDTPEATPNIENTILINEDKNSELRATVDYYFAYPKGSTDIKPLSESDLRNLLVTNGANKVKDNLYEMKIDGNVYQYNVSTHEILIPNGNGMNESKTKCFFLAKPGVDFKSITSTITLLAGQGEKGEPLKESAFGSGKLGVGPNTLVIVPSVSGNTHQVPYKIGGATRIGDFICGGSERAITNSIVGYSLGGMGSYASVMVNKGLYKNMAVVNGGPRYINSYGSYSNFKGVNMYIFEGSGDSFIDDNIKLLKNLKNAGVDMKQVHIYTTDGRLYNNAGNYNVYREDIDRMKAFAKEKNHLGWSAHSHGYRMLEDSGIYSYLSRL